MSWRGWGVLLLVGLLAGCGASVPELLEQARAYQGRGEKIPAMIQLKNALAKDPANVEAHLLLGTMYAEVGEVLDAGKEFRKALELGASPGLVLPALGRVLLETEQYQALLDEIRPTALGPQEQAEIALLRGRAHLRLGAVTDARTQFFLAMRDQPTAAKLGLAQVAAAEGDVKVVGKLLDELAGVPENAEVWMFKGDFARAGGKIPEALAAFSQAAKLQPSNVPARLNLAVAHISSGNHDAARAEIEVVRKLAPASPQLHFTRALLALREQKFNDCREALQQVGRQIPQHMPSVLLSGSMLFSTGQLEQAAQAFSTYLARFPGNLYARKMLAATHLRNAQPRSAAQTMEPLLAQKSEDPELLSLAGQAYLQLGDVRRARQYLERAASIDPDNSRTRANLGLARLAGGQKQQAVSDLESAVALKPNDNRADSYLIMALIAHNDTEKALRAAQALEQKQPNEPLTYLLFGAVYLAKQDMAQARASFERALKIRPGYFPAAASLTNLDLREKNPDGARERLVTLLKHDPRNLDALLTLANVDLDAGRHSAAVGWLRRAQAEHPQAMQPYLMLAHTQLQSGEPAEALKAARQARDMNPGDPRTLEILGRAQFAVGDKSAAIASFTTLMGMLPESMPVRLELARLLIANGDQREALALVKKGLQTDPANADAVAVLAAAYLETKRYSDALELAVQAQKKTPRLGYTLEGDALMAQQDYAKAAAAYRKADAIAGNGMLRIRIHQADSLSSKGAASDAALVEWVARHPKDINPRLYLADQYAKAGRYKAAIAHYEALLQVDPKDVRIINNLAWTLLQDGDPRGVDFAHQAFQLKPDDAAVADTLGWALVNSGKLYEGIQIMLKAVSLDPGNPNYRYRLAQSLVRAGDDARARNELKTLLASGKKFAGMEQAQALLKKLSQ